MNADQITIADLQAKAVELAKEHGVTVVIDAESWAQSYDGGITPSLSFRVHAIDKASFTAETLELAIEGMEAQCGTAAMLARAEKLEAEAAKLRAMASAPEGVAA